MDGSELIYVPLDGTIDILTEDGIVQLTCVECFERGNGCTGCYWKRESGKPQYPFCNAIACGDFERMDEKDVIFQVIKSK